MARTSKISVMVSEQIKEKLKNLSGRMGMTESALVAYIVGQWVYTQEAVSGKVMDLLSGDDLKSIITKGSDGAGADRT